MKVSAITCFVWLQIANYGNAMKFARDCGDPVITAVWTELDEIAKGTSARIVQYKFAQSGAMRHRYAKPEDSEKPTVYSRPNDGGTIIKLPMVSGAANADIIVTQVKKFSSEIKEMFMRERWGINILLGIGAAYYNTEKGGVMSHLTLYFCHAIETLEANQSVGLILKTLSLGTTLKSTEVSLKLQVHADLHATKLTHLKRIQEEVGYEVGVQYSRYIFKTAETEHVKYHIQKLFRENAGFLKMKEEWLKTKRLVACAISCIPVGRYSEFGPDKQKLKKKRSLWSIVFACAFVNSQLLPEEEKKVLGSLRKIHPYLKFSTTAEMANQIASLPANHPLKFEIHEDIVVRELFGSVICLFKISGFSGDFLVAEKFKEKLGIERRVGTLAQVGFAKYPAGLHTILVVVFLIRDMTLGTLFDETVFNAAATFAVAEGFRAVGEYKRDPTTYLRNQHKIDLIIPVIPVGSSVGINTMITPKILTVNVLYCDELGHKLAVKESFANEVTLELKKIRETKSSSETIASTELSLNFNWVVFEIELSNCAYPSAKLLASFVMWIAFERWGLARLKLENLEINEFAQEVAETHARGYMSQARLKKVQNAGYVILSIESTNEMIKNILPRLKTDQKFNTRGSLKVGVFWAKLIEANGGLDTFRITMVYLRLEEGDAAMSPWI